MKTCLSLLLLFSVLTVGAQTTKPTSSPLPAKPASPAALPSAAQVDEFLRRMFGFDPNVTWTIQAIVPTDAPGVAHVIATIGSQQRPVHLYVLPGGKFAVAGEYLPFGPDPFAAVRTILAATARGVARGPATAVVTLVEFSDLQCPFCRSAQPVIERLVAETPDVRLVFQPFPLPMHQWAVKAAAYAECVEKQKPGSFWGFVNGVYDDQANISDQNFDTKLAAIATAAGVDVGQVASCADSPEIHLRIQQSMELGKSVGVNSTPTLFINGRRIAGIADMPYAQLKAMVEFEVAEARKKK